MQHIMQCRAMGVFMYAWTHTRIKYSLLMIPNAERRAIFKRVRHKWDTHTRTTALCKTHSEKLVILLDWYSNNEKRSYIYRPVALRRIDFFYSAPHKEMFHSKIIFLHIRQGKCVCLLLDTQQCYSSHTHSRTKLWFCYLLGWGF